VAQYLLFDGALNRTFLGLQFYIWVMLAFFILTIGSYCVWYFMFWMPLDAVKGHFTAHLRKINSALTFNENLNFVMKSEKMAKLIFDIPVKEAKELQKDWDYAPSGLIGKVLDDLIFITNDWDKLGSPTRIAIERIAATYNDTNPEDMVMTLDKFHRRLVEGAFNGMEGVSSIKPYYPVSWARIDFAIPEEHIQPMWDGYLRQLARQEDKEENSGPSVNLGYGIIIGGVVVSIGILAMKFMTS